MGYGLILAVLWVPRPWQRPFYLITAVFLLLASFFSGETLRDLGLSAHQLLRSSLIIVLAATICGVSLLVAATLGAMHGPTGVHAFFQRYWGFTIWSFEQQFLLQDFFLVRFLRLMPRHRGRAIVAAAGTFALAHLPNPILTAFTIIWGLIACAAFERHRNLYPLGVAHAMLGITVAIALPGPSTHNMHVGRGYFHYRTSELKQPDHRRARDQIVSARVWVSAAAATLRS